MQIVSDDALVVVGGQDAGGRPVILIVEDDRNMRELIAMVLDGLEAELVLTESAQDALDYLESHPVAVLVTDLRMPQVDGLTVLRFARQRDPQTQVVMVTGHATVESAVASLKAGAYDYVCKPFDNVELLCTVQRALEHWRLTRENQRLRQENRIHTEGTLIGRSAAMDEVQRLIHAASAYDCSVLITGESGSGKELVARQIHFSSARHGNSFVAINCAAIPENIIESELFGYQRGAFTGADRSKPGLFERASGGTIFLDELNNASLSLQVKLLRVLQDGTYYRLGDTEPRNVDLRVLAATNRDIQKLIAQESFREDLYYRLRVVEIHIPPLRERRDDIPLLANYFVNKYSQRLGKEIKGITTRALGALMRHDWPGNVRELENVIQRMMILGRGDQIDIDGLPPDVSADQEPPLRAIDYMQPQTLEEIAEILGIDKSTLWRKIKRYGLE